MAERILSGRYALRDIVGTGGMSIVYRAWDSQQRREVAVKVLREEFSNDEEFVRRFTNEAHAVLQMHHANIVDIYGLGQDGQTRYIVMEYVDGVTLKEMIRQEGPIKIRRAVQMVIRILAAVDHAHKNHIVHRDIKPQNIMVNADFQVKVTDFGIARATNADHQNPVDVPEREQKPEPRKNVLGSVHYFSPEQASGHVADEKSDLYSVGVVLYEMLTGKVPFDGDSAEDVAIKHVRETAVPPSSVLPEISRALDQVIERALAKDPQQRYQTAAEMAADLKRALQMPDGGFIETEQVQPPEEPQPKKKISIQPGKLLRAAAVAAVAAVLIGAFFLGRGVMRRVLATIETPDMVEMNIEDAVDRLDAEGILYLIEETPEGEKPIGTIIGQYPPAGERLERGSRLTLYVSTGAHSSYVPTLVGMDVHDAQERIIEYGLSVGTVEYVLSLEKPGTVIDQEPNQGTYAIDDSMVNMLVSGQSAAMPDCSGYTLEEAKILLDLDGFALGSVTDVIGESAPDTVIGQSVSPGKQTLAGETVDLTVSRLDPETAKRCNLRIRFTVPTERSEVRMTLEDGDGLRTVYRYQLVQGEHEVDLTLLSRTQGMHRLCVYIDGETAIEKEIEFR